MEKALWYLLAGTRGGRNRARIIRSLDDRPKNANRLADQLGVDYNTVRHHLDMLVDHDIVEAGGEDYGELYFLTDRFEANREAFERVTDSADFDVGTTDDSSGNDSESTEIDTDTLN